VRSPLNFALEGGGLSVFLFGPSRAYSGGAASPPRCGATGLLKKQDRFYTSTGDTRAVIQITIPSRQIDRLQATIE
jgi:hypothetical protein